MTQPVRRWYAFTQSMNTRATSNQDEFVLATDYLALEAERDALLPKAEDHDLALAAMGEIRKLCYEIMGGNCSFIDDDFGRALITLRDERDALRADARRYRWLRDHKCNSLHLTHDGDHACNYTTAKEWIEEFQPDWYADDSPQDIQQMKDANTIWCLQIYPNTPIGFNVWNSATLDAVVDRAIAEDDSALATQEAG